MSLEYTIYVNYNYLWKLQKSLNGGRGKYMLHGIIIEKELIEKKTFSALIYGIERGREVEFSYNEKEYFISKDGSSKYVSIWIEKEESAYDSVEDLIENHKIEGKCFIDMWEDVEILFVF